MEFLSVVKVAETAEKLLSAADKLNKKAEKAKKVPQEDAKYYGAYLEVAGIVIQSLENEYLEILKQADRTNLKDPKQKELLRTRINDYLYGEVLRPKLTTAVEHLEAGRDAFKKHAKGFPLLSYDLYRAEGMHQAHGDPAPERRVRAGPRVAYTDDPCRHRNAVHDETPVTVEDAAHGEHVGDRLTVEQVCVQRTCGDESRPMLGIAEFLQRLVARGDEHGHRPGARVAGEREERKRMKVCQKRRAVGRHQPGRRAEKPRVIDESRVLGLLDRTASSDGLQPVR